MGSLVAIAGVVAIVYIVAKIVGQSNADDPSIVLAPDTIYMPTTSQQLAEAIAQAEGYGVPGAIPTRANNPGDLKLGDRGLGVLGESPGITIFPTINDGWAALIHQCDLMLTGRSQMYSLDMTLIDVGSKYASDPNWGYNVANALGVSPLTTLSQLGGAVAV